MSCLRAGKSDHNKLNTDLMFRKEFCSHFLYAHIFQGVIITELSDLVSQAVVMSSQEVMSMRMLLCQHNKVLTLYHNPTDMYSYFLVHFIIGTILCFV